METFKNEQVNSTKIHQKQSNIPQIRFKGFNDAWEQRRLGDIANKFFGGGTPKTSVKKYWDGNLPWIQSSDLVVGRLFDIKPKKYISENGLNNSASKQVPANSIAIVTRVGVGKVGYFPYSYATSQDFISFSNLNIDTLFGTFLCYKTLNGNLNLQGSSIKGITGVTARNFIIKIPQQKYEQFNIGQFMYHADKLITLHQRKCDQLKNIKKSLLEKLFPKNGTLYPELRFKEFTDAWEQRRFGELYKINNERNLIGITVDKTLSVATMKYKKDGNGSAETSVKSYKVLRIGDAGFEGHSNKQFAHGRFVVNTRGIGLMSPRFSSIRPVSMLNPWFTKKLFYLESIFRPILDQSTKLGTMMNELVPEDFFKQVILIPGIEEQNKIGNLFLDIDKFITLHQRKVEKLKKVKASLLEKMFV